MKATDIIQNSAQSAAGGSDKRNENREGKKIISEICIFILTTEVGIV